MINLEFNSMTQRVCSCGRSHCCPLVRQNLVTCAWAPVACLCSFLQCCKQPEKLPRSFSPMSLESPCTCDAGMQHDCWTAACTYTASEVSQLHGCFVIAGWEGKRQNSQGHLEVTQAEEAKESAEPAKKQGKEQKKKKKAATVKPAASKPNLGSIGSLQSKDIATQIADPLGGSIVHSLQGQVCLRRNPLSYLCMAGLPEV